MPSKPPTTNVLWHDAHVRHQMGLLRVSGGLRNRLAEILDGTESAIRHSIVDQTKRIPQFQSPAAVKRTEVLLAEINGMRAEAWVEVFDLWRAEMVEIASAEPEFMRRILKTVSPVDVEPLKMPTKRELKKIVSTKPVRGRLFDEWITGLRSADMQRIQDAVKVGIADGVAPKSIAQRVVGTRRLQGSNGVLQATRTNMAAINRTSVLDFAQHARTAFFKQNADLFMMELYVAIMDSRTSIVCAGLSGHRYPMGSGPYPPQHMLCRSQRIPILNANEMGTRPTTPTSDRIMLREFAEKKGFDPVSKRSMLPHGTKGEFDNFRRLRIRQVVGTAPTTSTYSTFLRRQSVEFQNEVLGTTRAQLFRRGKLPMEKFVNDAGGTLPLSDLAKMHGDAFKAAGLNPKEFL